MTVGEMRAAVLIRDGGCIAIRLDWQAGPCRDQWGAHIPEDCLPEMELDYIRLRATGKRHELASDHVTLCPGHHRGTGAQQGYVWATAHRAELREYLETCESDTERPTI